jgi:hypothetical protein
MMRRPARLLPMEASDWRVIVIRAWREARGIRLRVLVDDGVSRRWTVASGTEAGAIVQLLVSELEDSANPDPDQSRGSSPQPPPS